MCTTEEELGRLLEGFFTTQTEKNIMRRDSDSTSSSLSCLPFLRNKVSPKDASRLRALALAKKQFAMYERDIKNGLRFVGLEGDIPMAIISTAVLKQCEAVDGSFLQGLSVSMLDNKAINEFANNWHYYGRLPRVIFTYSWMELKAFKSGLLAEQQRNAVNRLQSKANKQ